MESHLISVLIVRWLFYYEDVDGDSIVMAVLLGLSYATHSRISNELSIVWRKLMKPPDLSTFDGIAGMLTFHWLVFISILPAGYHT